MNAHVPTHTHTHARTHNHIHTQSNSTRSGSRKGRERGCTPGTSPRQSAWRMSPSRPGRRGPQWRSWGSSYRSPCTDLTAVLCNNPKHDPIGHRQHQEDLSACILQETLITDGPLFTSYPGRSRDIACRNPRGPTPDVCGATTRRTSLSILQFLWSRRSSTSQVLDHSFLDDSTEPDIEGAKEKSATYGA